MRNVGATAQTRAPRSRLITQSRTKRVVAAAIAAAKARNDWSNSDAGDALGCCEGTIRNRIDADDPHHQMTVHELLRAIQAGELHLANDIVGDVECLLVSLSPESAPDMAMVVELMKAATEAVERHRDGEWCGNDRKALAELFGRLLPMLAAFVWGTRR